MSYERECCRCCCSSGKLKPLPDSVMDIYKLICSLQDFENYNYQIVTCLQCCKFLEEVDRFKIECHATVGIFSEDLVSKCLNVESTFKDPIQEKSSQINIKTNVIEEIQEIHQNDIHIDKLGINYYPENSQDMIEISSGLIKPTHTNDGPFACDHCNYRTKRKERLIDHKLIHIDQTLNSFKCVECSFVTTNIKNLKLHERKHSDEKPFKCKLCNYRGKRKIYLTSHMNSHLKDCEKSYKCNECSFTTGRMQYLKRHVLSKHTDERPFACDHCNYRCKLKKVLIKHINIHLKCSIFKCSQCSYESTSRCGLTSHILSKHSNDKPFSCDQCDYRTKRNDHLAKHKERHLTHRKKPFKCSECSFETTRLAIVKSHFMTKHSDERPFACNQCEYRGKTKNFLNGHMKTHLDDSSKTHKCSECSYTTNRKTRLKCHVAVKHSDERRFECDYCGHRAKTKTNIFRHVKGHQKDCNKTTKYLKISKTDSLRMCGDGTAIDQCKFK